MKIRHSPSGASEGDLCDTCSGSGDTDDVASVCSWTTDFSWDLCDYSDDVAHTTIPADVANQNPGACAMLGVPMQMCYVVMPTMSSTVLGQNVDTMQEQWSHLNQHWGEFRSHAWPTHVQASTGYSTPELRNNNKSHSNSISSAERCSSSQCSESSATTSVILRNLPLECTRELLLQMLDDQGFSGTYDFVHVPTDFQTKLGLGYALLNLETYEVAVSVIEHFEGFSNWPCHSDNFCEVAWNSPHQGLEAHVERYRNSPLMHASISEAFRPALFENGVRVEFPAPTTRIRAPRIRHQKLGKGQSQPQHLAQMATAQMRTEDLKW